MNFPGNTAYLIEQRLEFVEIISSLKPGFSDPNLITDTPFGGWTHPWLHFDSLRIHLLLTCFDLLGQPDQWIDFDSWLSSNSRHDERKDVLANLSNDASPADVAKEVHLAYSRLYGVKRSFFRFMNEIVPDEVLNDLLFSVKIRRIDRQRNAEIQVLEAPEKKKDFLYKIRNSYTHRAIEAGSAGASVFPKLHEPKIIDGVKKWGYSPIYWEHKDSEYFELSVRKWPDVLIETVRQGLITTQAAISN